MLFLFALYFHSVSEFEVTIYPVNIRFGEDVLKTPWRRLENIFSVTSSKRLQDKIARRLLEDFLKKTSCKHVLKTSYKSVLQTPLEDILKTSWKTKNCYGEDIFKTSWRRLGKQEMFAGQDRLDWKKYFEH